jgi:hypothetical protein
MLKRVRLVKGLLTAALFSGTAFAAPVGCAVEPENEQPAPGVLGQLLGSDKGDGCSSKLCAAACENLVKCDVIDDAKSCVPVCTLTGDEDKVGWAAKASCEQIDKALSCDCDNKGGGKSGDKPEGGGKDGDKPEGDGKDGDKPEGDSKGGDKPEGDGKGGDKPEGDSKGGDKPEGDGKGGDKPEGDGKGGDKPEGDGCGCNH